jgi:energy-coupling factor transport system permease protein
MERFYVTRPVYPPLCILFSFVMLLGGLLVSGRGVFPFLLIAMALIYLAFGYGWVLLKCLLVFVPLGLLVGFISYLLAGQEIAAWQMAGRILLLGLCAVPTISMQPIFLTRSLAGLHCPRTLTLGMLVTIRFFPILIREMRQILEAMRTRGVRVTMNPLVLYRAFLIPLTMRLVGISEILSLSIETRAFDLHGAEQTIYRPVRFTIRDGIFCTLMIVCVVGMIAGVVVWE